jgi:hypothetical protein
MNGTLCTFVGGKQDGREIIVPDTVEILRWPEVNGDTTTATVDSLSIPPDPTFRLDLYKRRDNRLVFIGSMT